MVLLGVNVTVVCGAGGPFDGERTHRHQCIRRFALMAVAVVSEAVARVLCGCRAVGRTRKVQVPGDQQPRVAGNLGISCAPNSLRLLYHVESSQSLPTL